MRLAVVAVLALSAVSRSAAQAPRQLTAADYSRAEQFLSYRTAPLVFGLSARPSWLANDRFWYRNTIPQGTEYVLVDPAARSRSRLFDHERLAAGLSAAADSTFGALQLPFTRLDLSADGRTITFEARTKNWTCSLQTYRCNPAAAKVTAPASSVTSPDGTRAAFIRDWNLWVKDLSTGRETRLTGDGMKDFGYATDNAGWAMSDRPVILWSPDSRKIATFQQDERNVAEMYLVKTELGHPTLKAWKYPLVGDTAVAMIHRVIVSVDTPAVVRLQLPPDYHRSTTCDHVLCGGVFTDVEWSPDARQLAFVSTSRDHKEAKLRVADAATGRVRDVLEERVPDFFESGRGKVNWHVLFGSGEVIWF